MADRGMALGRLKGKAVFVEYAAPGDLAEVDITREKEGWALAKISRLLEPGPGRIEPACPVFGVCGGCDWQHIDHGSEVSGKAESLKGFFSTRLKLLESVFATPLASPRPYGYRNRLTLTVASRSGKPALGMLGKRSNTLVKIDHCPIATEGVNRVLKHFADSPPLLGLLPDQSRVLLQEDGAGNVWVLFITERSPGPKTVEAISSWSRETGVAEVWWASGGREPEALCGTGSDRMPFSRTVGGKMLQWNVPVGCFVQANTEMSDAMVARILTMKGLYAGSTVLDLYCGSGNFTLPLALDAARVIGVEGESRAADAARKSADGAGFGNIEIRALPVEKAQADGLPAADFWLLDPPRTGAGGIMPDGAKGPTGICYISCSPATLARDLMALADGGYRVESIRAVDMFPRTAHLEVLALLSRRL